MRIGIYVSNEYPTPLPPGTIHGAISVATALANGLTQRGHHVDYFCTTESRTPAHKQSLGYKAFIHVPHYDRLAGSPQRRQYSVMYSQRMIADINRFIRRHRLDLLHFHNAQEVVPLLPFIQDIPKVITFHESVFQDESESAYFNHFFLELYRKLPNTYFVSISKRQQAGMPRGTFFTNVYDGIDTDTFKFNQVAQEYLFFSGRFIPEKGIDIALRVAQQAKRQIKVAGLFDPRVDTSPQFYQTVQTLLRNPTTKHYGKLTTPQLVQLYGKAAALLAPLQWEEPFGLVMAEAMACGTPVIAFKRGAAPELIRDGKTGFVVRTAPEMVRAIKKIHTINRQTCRTHIEKNFSLATMVSHYETLYASILKRPYQRLA